MALILLSLLLLAALAGGFLLWRSRARVAVPAAPARPQRTPLPAAAPASVGAAQRPPVAAAANPPPPLVLPPALVGSFRWLLADDLPCTQRQALTEAMASIRRPPAAVHQMLSPQFLDRASSQALSDLISGEAQIAAKVLASVNAPHHGLSRPVSSIGQAITFLGLNTVRSICLRDLLDDSFPHRPAALRQTTRELWNASALASELCSRLAARLGLADSGTLVAQTLLSFLGHLAMSTLLAAKDEDPASTGPLLARTARAQAALGLGPAELGGLLLQAWGLPDPIIDGVRAIDRLLVVPAGGRDAETHQRLALAHLCARIGEQLACSSASPASAAGLAGLAMAITDAEESYHLREHLAAPMFARLPELLLSADLAQPLLALQQGMRGPR